MEPRDQVRLEGFKLGVGESFSPDFCYFCKGGDNRDKRSLGITRDSKLVVLYNCSRAKCGVRGRILSGGGGDSTVVARPVQFTPNIYKGLVREPSIEELALLYDLWKVDLEDVYNAGWVVAAQEGGHLPLIMPVISPTGVIRGHVLRVQHEDGSKTVRGFKAVDEPWLCWYVNNSDDIVVVEDQISALRAAEFCTSVSLLGAALAEEKFEEVLRVAGDKKRVWIALDRDALKKGLEFLKRYQLYCPNLKLLVLTKDIKNMSTTEMISLGGPFRA
jgi:hypothetical protein